ncbi:cytochrome P450 [Streptomyces tubbatahanensis]|uniref:Cytochrome P450 n=1 Tax=Streptomyces tubbatahanensis TaxID=2923272 RepID=A0ABY3Y1D9_9ACTN|nr:cytochrome P450 [Streptomyces tubbatahanensis]UNT00652.1 cytochrome P450 [Streptomyces tubbatahanensis]
MSENEGAAMDTGSPPPAGGCPFGPNGAGFNPFATPGFADLYQQFETARERSPVFYSEPFHMWIVSRYDDVLAILKDADRFSSSTRPIILSSFPDGIRTVLEKTHTFAAPNLAFDGRPAHDRLRGPVAKYFSAKAMIRRESRIRDIMTRCLDEMPEGSPLDLVESFARPVASRVIIDLAGLPPADHGRIMRYHEAVNGFFFGNPPVERQPGYAQDVQELEAYLAEVIDQCRRTPRDGLISHLLQLVAKGEADYTDAELISLISFDVLAAGIRPAGFVIVNLCRELLRDPRHWESVRADPSLFDNAFNEALRRSGIGLGVFRTTTADVDVAGTRIPAGSVIWAMVSSADYDESRFPDPGVFDPSRTNLAGSLHFSQGLHYCLGSYLARTVARVGLDLLMRRHPGLRLVPDQRVAYEPSINLMIPTALLLER